MGRRLRVWAFPYEPIDVRSAWGDCTFATLELPAFRRAKSDRVHVSPARLTTSSSRDSVRNAPCLLNARSGQTLHALVPKSARGHEGDGVRRARNRARAR